MQHQPNPDGLYDTVVDGRSYNYCNSDVPIRDGVIDTIAEEYTGKTTSVDIEAPDDTTHVVSGDGEVPNKETLISELNDAAAAFDSHPVSLLNNLFGAHLGPLHYTNQSAHFVVGDEVYEADGHRGTDSLPDAFKRLGVKLAHTLEGFQIAQSKTYHWKQDLSWSETESEQADPIDEDTDEQSEYRTDKSDRDEEPSPPSVSNCWIINAHAIFPAQRLGQTINIGSIGATHLIHQTERISEETLLTKRQSQYRAMHSLEEWIEEYPAANSYEMEFEEIVKEVFDLSDSGCRSLQSGIKKRKQAAFETLRELDESRCLGRAMDNYAETVEDVARLAWSGAIKRHGLDDIQDAD
jgi:hypothetical protein